MRENPDYANQTGQARNHERLAVWRPRHHQDQAPNDTLVLLGDVEWNDFGGMDDAIHTTAIHDDDWEAAFVAKANGDVPDDEDCGDEEEGADEEEPPARPTLSARDATSSVKDLLDFARVANDAAMIDAATSLENIVEMHCVKQAATARQTTMLEFFQRYLTWCVIQPPCIQHTVQHTCVFTCMHYPVNKYCCFFTHFQLCSFHVSLHSVLSLNVVLYTVVHVLWNVCCLMCVFDLT